MNKITNEKELNKIINEIIQNNNDLSIQNNKLKELCLNIVYIY